MPFKKKKSGIPDRWLDYRAVGRRIPGTRFIAFKVPLKPSLNSRVQQADAFGPWDLLDALEKENHQLSLIIDLTFTTRYYKLADVPESWSYVKILTEGHHVPSDATILSFKRAVRRFLRDNRDNDTLIGIHCTHGLNRTGYLVCRYLIDVDGMDPREAVELFNSSRGHPIERQNYLQDLQSGRRRSNEGMDESEQEPMRGHAVARPCSAPIGSDPREERRPHSDDRLNRGAQHQRGLGPRPPQGGLLPPPPLLPTPPYRIASPLLQYQWSPTRPGAQRRQEVRPRAPPPEPAWSSSEERRSHYPPPPPPSLPPHYTSSTFWTSEPNCQNQCEERAGPKKRLRHRHKHRQ